jgi:TolB-like protein/ketosteroid isomerase-like protein
MHDVFISHVEEDAIPVLEIALGLEQAGYTTWCYEHHTLPGVSYLIQTGRAIENCKAVVLVISPHAIGSRQVTKEVVRAHECNKHFIPVLAGVTHAEFQMREPEWREALGAAASIRLTEKGAAGILPRLIEGLEGLGVAPAAPADPKRIAALRETLREFHGREAGAGDPRAARVRPRDVPPDGYDGAGAQHGDAGRGGARGAAGSSVRWGMAGLAALLLVSGAATYVWRGDGQLAPDAPSQERPTHREVAVGVMEFESQGTGPELKSMCQATRDSLNTILSKVEELNVYSKEMIDFKREKQGLHEIEAAQQLGITKMVSGTVSMHDTRVRLEVRLIDIATGHLDASIPLQGSRDGLIELQNNVAVALLRALNVEVTPGRREALFAHRTNETSDGYDMLYDSLGDFVENEAEPSARLRPGGWAPLAFLAAPAHAADGAAPSADRAAIDELLEQYRAALESENMSQLDAIHVALEEKQRQGLRRYFDNAEGLKVELSDLQVLVEGDEALATFTRLDSFTDARSGREVHLEVRLSSLLAKLDGQWKIRGLKKPS